ncbi:hypothetical protein JL720_16811 [Aureococcus anophagefferens]|nr:hypothetical protein JL720_16811 [Aureococcus anophagefferens]
MFADDEVMLDETSDVIVSDESPAPAEDFPDLDDDVDAADLDRDAADDGARVGVNAALLLLERKRRAALRAVLIFAADERALATQATRDQAP